MPLPLGHCAVKCVIYGTIGSVQSWSTAFWMDTGIGVAVTQAALDDYATAIAGLVSDFYGGVATHLGPGTSIAGVRLYHYASGGLVSDMLSDHVYTSPAHGTATADGPSVICQVASLRSSTPGKSGRGRMYIPVTGLSSLLGDYLVPGVVSDYTDAVGVLLSDANGLIPAFDSGRGLAVVASFTKGATYPIVQVRGGNRYEIQRRRNDQFPDTANATTPVTT